MIQVRKAERGEFNLPKSEKTKKRQTKHTTSLQDASSPSEKLSQGEKKAGEKTWGGFSTMWEYEKTRKKLKETKSAVPVTVLLCILFTLALSSIILVFFAAYRNADAEKDAPEQSGNASEQGESDDTDEMTALSSPREQLSVWQYLRSISTRDSEIIEELEVAPGQTTMLGISGVEISQNEADLYHIPAGILVCDISQRSTAYICGLRRTDIIQTFNGNRIYTMQDLIEEKAKCSVGQRITLTIFRDDDVLEFKFLLQPAP